VPMSPATIANFQFNVGFVKLCLDKTPDANFAVKPAEGVHPIAWQLGHIVYAVAGAADLLGFTVALPDDFKDRYGIGSTPATDPAAYESKADLLDKLDTAAAAVVDAAHKAGPDHLAKPSPMEGLREHGLATIDDLATFLMTGHLMTHAGQLATARRIQGLPSVL